MTSYWLNSFPLLSYLAFLIKGTEVVHSFVFFDFFFFSFCEPVSCNKASHSGLPSTVGNGTASMQIGDSVASVLLIEACLFSWEFWHGLLSTLVFALHHSHDPHPLCLIHAHLCLSDKDFSSFYFGYVIPSSGISGTSNSFCYVAISPICKHHLFRLATFNHFFPRIIWVVQLVLLLLHPHHHVAFVTFLHQHHPCNTFYWFLSISPHHNMWRIYYIQLWPPSNCSRTLTQCGQN